MDPITGGLVSAGIKLLGGLFGGGSSPTPASNLLSQAKGARDASTKYGFNPLTMLKYGQTSGAIGGGGGGAPLASGDLLTGALLDVSDVVTGETERRAAANKLELELGQLKLDQLRGSLAVAPSATASVGSGLPALGRRSATFVGPGQTSLVWPSSSQVEVPLKASPNVYATSSGEDVTVVVGPDADEMATGAAIEAVGGVKARLRPYFPVDTFSFSNAFDIGAKAIPFLAPTLRMFPTIEQRETERAASAARSKARWDAMPDPDSPFILWSK